MIEGFDSNIKNYKFMALIISVCCIYGFLDSNNRKAVTTFFAEGVLRKPPMLQHSYS